MNGKVFFRRTGKTKDGQDVFMMVGAVTLNDIESVVVQPEHEYAICSAMLSSGTDVSRETAGKNIESIIDKMC